MEKNEKALLHQVYANSKEHKPSFENFKKTYEGLSIGDYCDEVFLDILENGTSEVETIFREKTANELKQSGISSTLLIENLLKGCDNVMSLFKDAIQAMVSSAIEFNKKIEHEKITSWQMKSKLICMNGNFNSSGDKINLKRLQIGGQIQLITECDKTFVLEQSIIEVKPVFETTYFIYAKIRRATGTGPLVVFTEPQPNTNDYFFILWQSGDFHEIKI